MPIINNIRLNLKKNDVLRREGFKGYSRVRPEIENNIAELLDSVNGENLLEPITAYEIYAIVEMRPNRVLLEGGAAVSGSLIPSTFPEAKELAIMVCTIGPGLEKRVTEYSQSGETLRGVLLDGIGSAAIDMLAQEVCRDISQKASSRGYQAGTPVNPGMPGLAITEQWNLLEMAHASEINVSLTSSGVMVPRKSTSQIIAIGTRMQTWTQADVCARCNLRETCPYSVITG